MLRRLRIKFILINMLLVTLVLLAVFGTLVYSTDQSVGAGECDSDDAALAPGRGSAPV